jgi:NADH-quinone oxidoreductase subunit M
MVLLTNLLTPIIILSGFKRTIQNAAGYFSLILLMQFALNGVFMAMDGLLYYIFGNWRSSRSFHCTGVPNRVNVTLKFFIYTSPKLLMLFGFIMLYWYNPEHSFDIRELYRTYISDKNQSWLFMFSGLCVKIPIAFPYLRLILTGNSY